MRDVSGIHKPNAEEVYEALETSPRGLSAEEARRRLEECGSDEIRKLALCAQLRRRKMGGEG